MGDCVSEKALHEAWQGSDGLRQTFATPDGQQFRVLYTGIPGGSYGPDFRDAVFETKDGTEVMGDVEIHADVTGWYTHGHDTDPNYERVVFHAVRESVSAGNDVITSLGTRVSEISIESLMDTVGKIVWRGSERRSSRAYLSDETPRRLDEWFDVAGDERFALKISGRRAEIERFGIDMTMHMAIFECLGYPRNGTAFRHLAKRLPWHFLARFSECQGVKMGCDGAMLSELLHWAAGFCERQDWFPVPRLPGDKPHWVAAAGRPANRPEIRLEAAAMLVRNWLRSGGPMRHALEVMRRVERSSEFRDAYRCTDGSLGAGRAGEIVVNAVLPTIAAWAEIGRDRSLYAEVMRLYRAHPSLPSNSVLEEAKGVLRRRGAYVRRLRGARRQQGVMHIFKSTLLRPRPSRQMKFGSRALSL